MNHLTLKAKEPGAHQAKFEELAAKAKSGCPRFEADDASMLNRNFAIHSTQTCRSSSRLAAGNRTMRHDYQHDPNQR
jgi:hypothetical protein